MEVQLQELIEQIKKDGVAAAEKEAKSIIDAAKAEAEKIIKDAEIQAEKSKADAKAENERIKKAGEDAIRQAGRNLLISFRESVVRELTLILNASVNGVYSSDALGGLIINAVEKWSADPDADDLAVILNGEDLKRLEEALLKAFNEKAINGITLKANDNFDGGFRIAINNGSAYYDFSKEEVVNMLSSYLSPKVTELLKEA